MRFETLVKPAAFRASAAFWLRAPERQWTMTSSFLCSANLARCADSMVADGNQRGAEVRDGVFVRLANIEDEDVFLRVELLLQSPRR